jgi:NarL family two-component system response regulator YdfI
LRREQPHLAIVILTAYNEDELMRAGLAAGGRGYLLKDTDRQTLFDTLRAAARGETLLKPEILTRLLAQPDSGHGGASLNLPNHDLSERELEVLQRVALGERSKEIAVRLGITERTVKAHLASIYNKLGVDSRAAAVSIASQRGLLLGG